MSALGSIKPHWSRWWREHEQMGCPQLWLSLQWIELNGCVHLNDETTQFSVATRDSLQLHWHKWWFGSLGENSQGLFVVPAIWSWAQHLIWWLYELCHCCIHMWNVTTEQWKARAWVSLQRVRSSQCGKRDKWQSNWTEHLLGHQVIKIWMKCKLPRQSSPQVATEL